MQKNKHSFRNLSIVLSSALLFLLGGCDTHYFDRPLPVDARDMSSFPSELQGYWWDDDQSENSLTLGIEKRQVKIIVHEPVVVVKGAWPKRQADGEILRAPAHMTPMERVNLDSNNIPKDTTLQYILRGNLLYQVEIDDGTIGRGYPFRQVGDTFWVDKRDTSFISLGPNARLRSIDKHTYAVSIRFHVLGNNSPWWYLVILQKNGKDTLRYIEPDDRLHEHPDMIYHHSGNWYYAAAWTRDNMGQMMRDTLLAETSTMVRKR